MGVAERLSSWRERTKEKAISAEITTKCDRAKRKYDVAFSSAKLPDVILDRYKNDPIYKAEIDKIVAVWNQNLEGAQRVWRRFQHVRPNIDTLLTSLSSIFSSLSAFVDEGAYSPRATLAATSWKADKLPSVAHWKEMQEMLGNLGREFNNFFERQDLHIVDLLLGNVVCPAGRKTIRVYDKRLHVTNNYKEERELVEIYYLKLLASLGCVECIFDILLSFSLQIRSYRSEAEASKKFWEQDAPKLFSENEALSREIKGWVGGAYPGDIGSVGKIIGFCDDIFGLIDTFFTEQLATHPD